MRSRSRLAALIASLTCLAAPAAAEAASLPAGFTEKVALSGLNTPTAVEFAQDGRVFAAEKGGKVKVYSSLSATTPTTYADLSTHVHDYGDRGLIGLALHPSFPTVDSLYVLYSVDAPLGGTAPTYNDACPDADTTGCPAHGRLSRIDSAGRETVLVEGWCQQFPSHSVAGLGFGPDGMLYAGGGDGASYSFVDWGQQGSPLNPCGDPPGGVGSLLSPPTAEGGALRAQDLRTSGDPTGLNGAILRLDPATGAPAAGNPLTGPDVNARRIIAYGLRNPFRFTFRPGTKELWAGDVGWDDWEEIDRIPDVTDSVVENFGWPCYEGSGRQPGYDNANLNICESLYAHSNATVAPYFSYRHRNPVVQNESCPIGGSSVAGLAFQFYTGSVYPSEYDGALFFADYSRNCIWAMQGGGNVLPSPSNIKVFLGGAAGPVELQMGPGGDLYYVSISTGTIRRISYTAAANQSPRAAVTATPTDGDAPLTVAFDGSGSRDPEGEPLAYAWDLDGDGAYDDSTAIRPSWTYVDKGEHVASLRVTDPAGASATDKVTIGVGRPKVTITSPTASLQYAAHDTVMVAGSATASDGTALPGSALSWTIVQNHGSCPSSCHDHYLQPLAGASGSFRAPDHEWPSSLTLTLKATDASGLTGQASVRIMPKTTSVTLASSPTGLKLVLNGAAATTTPFTRTVIVNSTNTISAPSPQTLKGKLRFIRWSDGSTLATRTVVAPAAPVTYTAIFDK